MPRYQHKISAFKSEVFLSLKLPSEKMARRILPQFAETIFKFEKDFSRFLPSSQLSKLNVRAGQKVAATPELLALAHIAKTMAEKSDGLYNPLLLPALQQAGYVGSWPSPEKFKPNLDFSKRKIYSANQIEIGDDWIKIPADSALDFGGIGKGYLLDYLADSAQKNDIYDFWFSLGGDILVSGNDEGRVGWEIAVANAKSDNEIIEKIITGGEKTAIATSGIIKRKGTKNNQLWHHLIDPRTGRPAQTDVLTATVVEDNATEADIWAKCLVILGTKNAEEFAKKKNIRAILQTDNKDKPIILSSLSSRTEA